MNGGQGEAEGYAFCQIGEGGFTAGDEVELGSHTSDQDSGAGGQRNDYGGSFWLSLRTGVLYSGCIAKGNKYKIAGKDGSEVNIASANWRIIFKMLYISTVPGPT